MSYFARTKITDTTGNIIDAEADHAGKYHLAVTVNQDVNESPENTSSTNLESGATWAGIVQVLIFMLL